MIPVNDFKAEIEDKLYEAYEEYLPGKYGNKFASEMGANMLLWDLQSPKVRQYLRYILARSDIDWTYVDDSTEV